MLLPDSNKPTYWHGNLFLGMVSMNRLQNLILILWGLALLLFIAFNWSLVNRVVDINYMFIDLQIKLLLWLALLGFAVPLGLRIISSLTLRTTQRRTEKEISSIKSKAYDGLTTEFSRLGEKLEGQLSTQLQSIAKAQPTPGETSEETPATEAGGNASKKKDKESS